MHLGPRPSLPAGSPLDGSHPGLGRRARTVARRSLVRSLTLMLGFAVVYLTARILAGAEGGSGAVGRGLLLAALLAAGSALWTARRVDDPDARRGWLLVAGGALAWAVGHLFRSETDLAGMVAFSAAYVLMLSSLTAGALVVGHLVIRAGDWGRVAVEVLPPVIAVLVGIWLVEVGPAIADGELSPRLRATAVLHGVTAAAAIVVGLAGFASRRSRGPNPAGASLLAGIAIVAVGDLLWLQHWVSRPTTLGTAADTTFCIGFVLVAIAALQGRTTEVMRAPSLAVVSPRLTSQATALSLTTLLVLCGVQVRWGQLAPLGVETTIAAALAVVLLAMLRDTITARRERALTTEIDTLSTRIDTLISQVGRDPLTGLLNHRSAHERLEHELAAGRASGGSVAVALIDVDNFKAVNDTLGHPMGDEVLKAVASVLTAACRTGDIAARYAGDEFMLVLPGLDEEHTAIVCRRILESVRRINRELRLEGRVSVTLSVGVAVTHRCRRSAAQVVSIADAAMYDAKEGGKDRFVVVDADTLTTATLWGIQPEGGSSGMPGRRGDERLAGRALAS